MKWVGCAWAICAPALLHAETAGCELRVWPSANSAATTGGILSNLGIAGALVDYERNKDGNLRDQVALIEGLTAPVQARLLSEAGLAGLFGIPGASVRFESRPPARGTAKNAQRHSSSTATCYAELIVTLNSYQKSTVHGRRLRTHFIFKDYRGDRLRSVSAKKASALRHFPPASAEEAERAQRDLMQAFKTNLTEFAEAVLTRSKRR